MRIGLDIDDVIFNTSNYIESVIEALNDDELYRIKADIMRGDASIPKVKEFLTKYLTRAIINARAMDNAAEVIDKLRNNKNKIILITARGDENFPGTEALTEEALSRAGIIYDEIVYNSSNKAEACLKYGVEIFVDDSPKNCKDVLNKLKIPVIGFESKITSGELHKNRIYCVTNWMELETTLREYTGSDPAI